GFRIVEKPIPTYYGDEICYVNGMRYAWDVVRVSTIARLQAYNLFHRRNFDVRPDSKRNAYYTPKLDFESPHSLALADVKAGETVMDVGCAGGYLANRVKAKGCRAIGVDKYPPVDSGSVDEFILHDLDQVPFPRSLEDVDV